MRLTRERRRDPHGGTRLEAARAYAPDAAIETEVRLVPVMGPARIDDDHARKAVTLARVRGADAGAEPEPERRFAPATRLTQRDRNLDLMRAIGARWHRLGRFVDPRPGAALAIRADGTREGAR